MTARITSPSFPAMPAVLAPTINFAGAITDANAAPAVCPAKIIGTLYPNNSAVLICKPAKITFEFVFDPVINAPIAPIHAVASGYALPTPSAKPRDNASVIPDSCMIIAIATISATLTVEGSIFRTVCEKILRPTPALYNPTRL